MQIIPNCALKIVQEKIKRFWREREVCLIIIELDKKEKEEVVKIFDNLGNLLYSPSNPKAFTERGLYMLARILKSPKAVETTIT